VDTEGGKSPALNVVVCLPQEGYGTLHQYTPQHLDAGTVSPTYLSTCFSIQREVPQCKGYITVSALGIPELGADLSNFTHDDNRLHGAVIVRSALAVKAI